MPKNILKNIRKISDAANARTTMPRKVLNPRNMQQDGNNQIRQLYTETGEMVAVFSQCGGYSDQKKIWTC